MKRLLMTLPLLALTACVQPKGDEAVTNPDPNACGASKYEGLIGQPAAALDKMTFPAGTRILRPNSPMTMDFRPDRLNIEIGKKGTVTKVSCF